MHRHLSGFTLVELILVIVIIGILAAVAGPRFFDRQAFDARLYVEEVRAGLRHAQKAALAGGCRVRFRLTDEGYRLWRDSDCDSATDDFSAPVIDPASGRLGYGGSAPQGLDLQPRDGFVVTFDARGGSGAALDASIDGHAIRVEAGTGLVR